MYGTGLFVVCLILVLFKFFFGLYFTAFFTLLLCYLFQFKWHLFGASLDLIGLLATLKIQTANVHSLKGWGVIDIFEETLRKFPNKPMMIMADTGETVTYSEMDERSNRVGKWLLEKGVTQGSTVALLMPNSIDYVATWLGVAKIGCHTALLNTNLSGVPLIHAIRTALETSPSRCLIVSDCYASSIMREDVKSALEEPFNSDSGGGGINRANVTILQVPAHCSAPGVGFGTDKSSQTNQANNSNQIDVTNQGSSQIDMSYRRSVKWDSPLFLIYTSGTTGLPKASKINHLRFWSAGLTIWKLCDNLNDSDRLYTALPLYHASGGMMAVSGIMLAGAALVVRPKFSASNFSRDLSVHKCTAMQYIGELCRYLVSAPPSPLDGTTRLKVAVGNGLRPEVWERFTKRYNVGKVVEFYAATEGNTNLFNNMNKVGAVGVIPWFAKFLYPVRLVRFDENKGELIRDKNGLCIECKAGEVGQILGLINDKDPSRRFDGYTDKAATQKKITHNVFVQGDKYFLSGDLMKKDDWGFFYWHDRIGDTFRWKGENVSTAEVSCIVSSILKEQISDVNIYGVEVPHCDGRAGMAAISLGNQVTLQDIEWDILYRRMSTELPVYANPVFIRVAAQLNYTTTFKHMKNELRDEGFDPRGIPDRIYFRDPSSKAYVELTDDVYEKICAGDLRL